MFLEITFYISSVVTQLTLMNHSVYSTIEYFLSDTFFPSYFEENEEKNYQNYFMVGNKRKK